MSVIDWNYKESKHYKAGYDIGLRNNPLTFCETGAEDWERYLSLQFNNDISARMELIGILDGFAAHLSADKDRIVRG